MTGVQTGALPIGLPKYIKVKHKLYEYQTFDNITVLEYSELDMLANEENFFELFQRLYKSINCTRKHWLKYLFIKNVKSFEDCNYFRMKLAIYQHFQWKKNLMLEYNLGYDNPNMKKEDQPDEVKLTPVEQFGMYHVVMQISQDNIQMFHWWQEKEIRELFKYLLYLRMKNQSN